MREKQEKCRKIIVGPRECLIWKEEVGLSSDQGTCFPKYPFLKFIFSNYLRSSKISLNTHILHYTFQITIKAGSTYYYTGHVVVYQIAFTLYCYTELIHT